MLIPTEIPLFLLSVFLSSLSFLILNEVFNRWWSAKNISKAKFPVGRIFMIYGQSERKTWAEM